MPRSIIGKHSNNQRGFTYVMVLVAVVVLGIMVEVATTTSSQAKRADQEAELLYRGMAFRSAIRSYYLVNGKCPSALNDLVQDTRHPNKHHLRALYRDPFAARDTENGGWSLIRGEGSGICGVASASSLEPRKKANFPEGLEKLENAASYSQWQFVYVPEKLVPPGLPGTGGAPPVGPPVRQIM